MRVAIFGAGLIGTHVCKLLVDEGHDVALFDSVASAEYVEEIVGHSVPLIRGDATDFASVMDLLLAHRIDTVVTTIGLIGGVAQRMPRAAMRANVVATMNIAEAARIAGVTRLLYISTTGVYDLDRCVSQPMTELSPTSAATVYPAGKLAAEHILEAYAKATELTVVVLRVANIYGRGHYVTGSIGGQSFNALVQPVAEGRAGVVLAGARGRGEWVYVKDVARAVCLGLKYQGSDDFLVVNIGTGHLTTHEDIINAVRRVHPDAAFDEGPLGGVGALRQRHQPYDLSFASETLGYTPQWQLNEGVADYLAELGELIDRRAEERGKI